MLIDHLQVEDGQLTDYEGTYARFLEKNAGEAAKMGVKEQKKKELEKSQIKAKSKVSIPAEHHARDARHVPASSGSSKTTQCKSTLLRLCWHFAWHGFLLCTVGHLSGLL